MGEHYAFKQLLLSLVLLTGTTVFAGGEVPFYPAHREADDQDLIDVQTKGRLKFSMGDADMTRPVIYLLPCAELKPLSTTGGRGQYISIPVEKLPPGVYAAIAHRLGPRMSKLKFVDFERTVLQGCIEAAAFLEQLDTPRLATEGVPPPPAPEPAPPSFAPLLLPAPASTDTDDWPRADMKKR